MKKLLVVSTIALCMCSSLAFAKGGRGYNGNEKMSKGTMTQFRNQIMDGSGFGSINNILGERIRARTKTQDGSGFGITNNDMGERIRARAKRQDGSHSGSGENGLGSRMRKKDGTCSNE